MKTLKLALAVFFCLAGSLTLAKKPKFRVISFYTAKSDLAHISFVHEANAWFTKAADKHGFTYQGTADWTKLTTDTLATYQVVLFLDTRPEDAKQRAAFQTYMENGGAWMGFHFSAFALTPSAFAQNWDWYHTTFLGSGQYGSNTWRPTSAVLKTEDTRHFATRGLPETFSSQPNEWYRWENDLRKNPDIRILLSIDPSSFPLGTGPKQHEIWHEGYYPVAWTNRSYRMLYINMGHNDMDYGGTNKALSSSFGNPMQDKLILQGLLGLGKGKK